jgi:hypothetical protein
MTMDLLIRTMTDKCETRPLVREGAPNEQDSNIHTRKKSGHGPQPVLDTKTDRLTDSQLHCDLDLYLEEVQLKYSSRRRQLKSGSDWNTEILNCVSVDKSVQ